ncbi:MAG: type IV pilus assembly protein PilM [Sedimentisphaerales bacterium]|nr:type IV pilus assembly protein PilM [Sedimentisphaerales bacterium]
MLNLKQLDVIGLDIGSSSVKIISMNRDNAGYIVKAAGYAEIAADSENNFDTVSDEKVMARIIDAINKCFATAKLRAKQKIKTNLAVCGVSGPEVAVRDFAFPRLPDEEIESAINLEADVLCPFNAGQASIDYQIISDNDDSTKGFIVAATKSLLASKKQLADKAGLKCVLMDVDGLALLNCFNNLAEDCDREASAILNVGSENTTLAIMNKDGWPFIHDTSSSGNDIIIQILNENEISKEVLYSILFNNEEDVPFDLASSLEKASDRLISSVSNALRFYAAQEKSVPLRKIYICGGFAIARGFIELLSRRLGTEVILWNPFSNIRCDASQGCKEILTKQGHALAVAAGLAMRSI